MIFVLLGLAVAAAFAGAAFYINWAEQPARLGLSDGALLAEWKPSYKRGFAMQASLALIGAGLGAAGFLAIGSTASAVGGLLLFANWPFTLIAIMPTNRRLLGTPEEKADQATRVLIVRWGKLHAIRTALGLAAVAAFLVAAI